MPDQVDPTANARAGWRLLGRPDVPFVYELVTKVDPRWWRFSRHGLSPMQLLQAVDSVAAGALVHDADGRPVACAILADAGASGTGMFEYYSLPDEHSIALAAQFAPEVIAAGFSGAPIHRLYHERFEGDPPVLGEMAPLFEVEVTYPAFAVIAGNYEARTTSVLTRPRFDDWQKGRA